MKIRLSYGRSDLEISLSDDLNIDILETKYAPALVDETVSMLDALCNPIASRPLREMVKTSDSVCIVINDITRATPYDIILPAILEELNHIRQDRIKLLISTGTHRPNTYNELCDMLGRNFVEQYRIVQNDANDISSHTLIGTTRSGNDIWIHKEYIECDLRILTGFIEPHFFAGFSGGGKACMPGMALLETIQRNHCPAKIDNPKATWGITNGNPIWEEVQEAAQMAGRNFLVNVTMNRDKKVTGVFTGDMKRAHECGCEFVKRNAMVPVQAPYDIVITSNSGYPLDLNLYQSVKGMSAAAQIVKDGGTIIIAADCWDGIPDHGEYKKLLFEADSPLSLLENIRTTNLNAQDLWQAQIHAMICHKADVYLFSHNLTDEQITQAMLKPCRDIPQIINSLLSYYGRQGSICVLPEGPLIIPYVYQEG